MERAAYRCAYIVPACNAVPLSCRYWANGPPASADAAAAAGGLFEGGYHLAYAAGEASRMDGHMPDSAHVAGLGLGLGRDALEPLTDPGRTGSRREREQQ